VLFINYFLFLGGGEKLMIEIIDFCLQNNIEPEVLVTDRAHFGDNKKEEYYDGYLQKKKVKIHRVPVFFKAYRRQLLTFLYWRFKLKFSSLFYDSVHIVNLNLADRIYDIAQNKKRVFWHIVNKMQFEGGQYNYSQRLLSQSDDTVVTINKYQRKELEEYFTSIRSKIIPFKLFLNR
jgi:hypothetical protein